MSTLAAPRPAVVIPRNISRPLLRPSTIIVALIFTLVLMVIAQQVVSAGYLRGDIEALQRGDAWRTGGWLSQVFLRLVSLLPGTSLQQLGLSLAVAGISGLVFGLLYDRLRAHGWRAYSAVFLLVALGMHAGELYTFTANSRAIPLYIAFAALIPAIRSLEDVGDVQANIGLGLLLPLLLLASPIAALLIVPLSICAALADPDARTDMRAFVAMMLVALLPTMIVAIGIVGFLMQARLDVGLALTSYVTAYTHLRFGDLGHSLMALVVFAPVMVVPIVYCFWPNLPEKRHVVSALAIVALPLYLAVARVIFTTTMTPMVPPLALIAAFISWLAVVQLPRALRRLAFVMLTLSVVASWTQVWLWDDSAWKAALFNLVPDEIAGMSLRPAIYGLSF